MVLSFERGLAWYVASADPEKRNLNGPQIARALTAHAKEVVTDTAPEDIATITESDGYMRLANRKGTTRWAPTWRAAKGSCTNCLRRSGGPRARVRYPEGAPGRLPAGRPPRLRHRPASTGSPPLAETEQAAVIANNGNRYDMTLGQRHPDIIWTAKRLIEHDRVAFGRKTGTRRTSTWTTSLPTPSPASWWRSATGRGMTRRPTTRKPWPPPWRQPACGRKPGPRSTTPRPPNAFIGRAMAAKLAVCQTTWSMVCMYELRTCGITLWSHATRYIPEGLELLKVCAALVRMCAIV